MVLSYYIATQTVEEHLRFLFIIDFFFLNCGFLHFLEKQNATHSSSRPRLVERDFYFENVGRDPYYTNNWLIPSTGLVFIYSGRRALQDQGELGGRWVVKRPRFPKDFSGRGVFQKGSPVVISSPTGADVLGSVDLYLGQCIRESLRGGRVNSGSSVHSVGRAKVVFPTPLVDVMMAPQSAYPSPHPLHSLWPSLQAALSHADRLHIWQTDGQQSKDFISCINNSSMLSNCYLPKKKQVTVSHQDVSSALHREWREIL